MAKRSKTERVYVVVFEGGKKARFFRDLTLLCSLLHLDYNVLGAYLRERGWWTGISFTVIAGTMETPKKNYGKY